jgi:hypothetical protein
MRHNDGTFEFLVAGCFLGVFVFFMLGVAVGVEMGREDIQAHCADHIPDTSKMIKERL